MGLTLITPPALAPITLQQAKDHLRVGHNDDDSVIEPLIAAATEEVEGPDSVYGRALLTQTWDWTLDCFPRRRSSALLLPLPPLQSVDQVSYTDSAGDLQTWDAAEYRVDIASRQGRLTPAFGFDWPQAQAITGAVTIRFTAGWGANPQDLPDNIRWAMLLMIGLWYSNRETASQKDLKEIPLGAAALLAKYRIWGF